eukprot:GHRR01008957.1.p1 GENE.GHRR01008957.1~~GHRR01008957.1.p1  ORF type:complete len:133 (+),score=12.84 GHRR01008957.1:576-974(+)
MLGKPHLPATEQAQVSMQTTNCNYNVAGCDHISGFANNGCCPNPGPWTSCTHGHLMCQSGNRVLRYDFNLAVAEPIAGKSRELHVLLTAVTCAAVSLYSERIHRYVPTCSPIKKQGSIKDLLFVLPQNQRHV